MERHEAERDLAKLAEHFQIPAPVLTWCGTRNGRYRPTNHEIFIGPKAWRGVASNVVHEFAHYLHHKRHMAMFPVPHVRPRLRPHGSGFHRALLDTVLAYYPNVMDYPWATEYRSLRNLFKRVVGPTPEPVACCAGHAEARITHAPFDAARAVQMYQDGIRMTDIVAATCGTRAAGHTGNLVRAAVRKAGIYRHAGI